MQHLDTAWRDSWQQLEHGGCLSTGVTVHQHLQGCCSRLTAMGGLTDCLLELCLRIAHLYACPRKDFWNCGGLRLIELIH